MTALPKQTLFRRGRRFVPGAPEQRLADPPRPPDTCATQADRRWLAKTPNVSQHPRSCRHRRPASARVYPHISGTSLFGECRFHGASALDVPFTPATRFFLHLMQRLHVNPEPKGIPETYYARFASLMEPPCRPLT